MEEKGGAIMDNTLTPEEFLSKLKEANASYSRIDHVRYRPVFHCVREEINLEDPDICIYKEWVIGGSTGGSCWDTGDAVRRPVDGEKEPEFSDLDNILLEVCPNISFLQYKQLMTIAEETRGGDSDYYGNHTNTAIVYITIKKLYEKLKGIGLI